LIVHARGREQATQSLKMSIERLPQYSMGVIGNPPSTSALGLVSRVTPVQTAMRNCTRDEGGPFEVGNQVLISSHRKLLWSKATVVNVAEKSKQDFDRYD
jgi:hypothetical protein